MAGSAAEKEQWSAEATRLARKERGQRQLSGLRSSSIRRAGGAGLPLHLWLGDQRVWNRDEWCMGLGNYLCNKFINDPGHGLIRNRTLSFFSGAGHPS